jgi:hypothetical protein
MQWKNKALDRIRFDNIRGKRSVVEKPQRRMNNIGGIKIC